jgi:putative Holliday junction resolvase
MPRILGLDYGDVRLGFAVSDPGGIIAFPHGMETCRTQDEALKAVEKVCKETGAEKIVVGYPLNMNGTRGPRADLTDAFMEKLKQRLKIPVEKWDERLSSKSAEAVLIEGGTRRENRKQFIDKLAAQIMLQNYLDAHAEPMDMDV